MSNAQPDGRPRIGRAPATTHGELSHLALALFLERGFEQTTVDDIVEAAGIGRRTFFRYFRSKNDLPWGDFDQLLGAVPGLRLGGAAVADPLDGWEHALDLNVPLPAHLIPAARQPPIAAGDLGV